MRKKSFWLLEIIIWFILLIGLISIGINFGIDYLNSRKTYNVTFRDVDSLIVGSPVRLMGIQVGHVTRIDLLDGQVNITFVITDNNVKILAGSTVNIQFTGLAGSKSLEIQPPKSTKHGEKFFNVTEPIRIVSIMNVQSDITRSVLDCSKLALSFLGNGGVEDIRENIKQSTLITKEINNTINDANISLHNSKAKIITKSQDMQEFMDSKNVIIEDFTNEEFKYPSTTKQSLILLLNDINRTNKLIENDDLNNYSAKTLNKFKVINKKMNKVQKNIESFKSPNPDYLDNIYNSFNKFIDGCFKTSNFIQKHFENKNIHKIHSQVEFIKKQSADTEQKL